MSTTAANRIALKGDFRYEEGIAGGAITPGHLIETYNSSGTEKLRVHSTAGGFAERAFATENALEGLRPGATPGGVTIDTAYGVAERVPYILGTRGSVVQAFLKAGVSYAIGQKLISNGDGTLQKDTIDSTVIKEDCIGVLEEAVDLSASAGKTGRGPVRLL